MGVLALEIKATLENVTNLQANGSDFNWTFKIKCLSCQEEHPKWVGIDGTDEVELNGSRGTANFAYKCTFCKRESSISHVESFKRANAFYTHEDSESQKFARLAVLDCRGCEITDFDPKGTWTAEGLESGTKFDAVEFDLEESDGWYDYDEKAGGPVSIIELENRIVRA